MADEIVGASVGDAARGVAVGKDIVMVHLNEARHEGRQESGVKSESEKLDQMYRLLRDISTEVAVLRTRLTSLAIGLALLFVLMILRLFQ